MDTLTTEKDKLQKELDDARATLELGETLVWMTKNYMPIDGSLFGKFWGKGGSGVGG